MAYAYPQQSMWSGRRLVALLVAIAVNLGMILAISNGLNFEFVKPEYQSLEAVVVEEQKPQDEIVVEMPEVKVTDPMPLVLDMPPPEVDIQIEAPPPPIAAAAVPQPPTAITPPPATQLQADSALTPPVYPAASIRAEEQGTVTLLIYVLPDGKVGDVKVAKSSGYPRLDQAAIQAARSGWRFKAATQGGGAVAAWGRYAVTFDLREAR